MHVQIDRFEGRFEDGDVAVALPHPHGGRSFDVPRGLFPGDAAEGDVFDVRAAFDRGETGRLAGENRRLLDGLTGDGR